MLNTVIKDALKTEILALLDKYPNGITPTKLTTMSLAKKRYEPEFRQALKELQNENRVELVMRKRWV